MGNHCVIHVIHQDIEDELRECSLFDFFYRLKLHQTISIFEALKSTIGKITTHSPTIQIIHIKVHYEF